MATEIHDFQTFISPRQQLYFLDTRTRNNFRSFLLREKLRNPSLNNIPPPAPHPAAVIALRAPTYPTELHLTHSTPQAKKDLLITLPATL